jgi:hypothetical protein
MKFILKTIVIHPLKNFLSVLLQEKEFKIGQLLKLKAVVSSFSKNDFKTK